MQSGDIVFIESRRAEVYYTAGLLRSVSEMKEIPGMAPALHELPRGCKFADRCPAVQERCRAEEPPLAPLGASQVRCHFPL